MRWPEYRDGAQWKYRGGNFHRVDEKFDDSNLKRLT